MRILTKGFSLPGVEHTAAEWDEPQNTKDYDLVFLDLDAIHERNDLVAPTSDVPQAIEFPDTEDVIELLQSGNGLYIFLPRSRNIDALEVESGETAESQIDLLSWLPFNIRTTEEPGESVATESISKNWQWYFDEDFQWPMYFEGIRPDTDEFTLATSFLTTTRTSLAQTTFQKDIAVQFSVADVQDMASSFSDGIERTYTGRIYALPVTPAYTPEGLTRDILRRNYHMEVEPAVSEPEWASNRKLPRQKEIIEISESLEQEYKELKQYRKLLYEQGDELEDIVLDAFAELGFETRTENPGGRDGMVLTEDTAYVLETHGTENATGIKKVDQLHRWVRGARDEFDDDFETIVGLLVGNAYRTDPPDDRQQPIVGDPLKQLRDQGYKYLTTVQLYRLLELSQQDAISKSDIDSLLQETDTVVSLPEFDH